MNVIAAVNGQITAEVSALYGLHFARVHGARLLLLHVGNQNDAIGAVEKSMAEIEAVADGYDLETERVILEGHPVEAVRRFLYDNRSEILFCSTRYRQHKKFFNLSFSEKLVNMALPADLAVARVVHVHSTLSTGRIVLPIREARMSAEKFTFFATMAKAYQAGGEIYSVTVTGRSKKAALDLGDTRRILQRIDDRLSHYVQLAEFLGIPLRLKHAITVNEVDQVLHHLSHNDFHLMIIGGQRLSAYSSITGSKPIDRLQRQTPVNTIAFYPRGKAR